MHRDLAIPSAAMPHVDVRPIVHGAEAARCWPTQGALIARVTVAVNV